MAFKIGDKVTISQEATASPIYHDQVEEIKKLLEVGEILKIKEGGVFGTVYHVAFPSIPIPLSITENCLDLAQSPGLVVDPFDIIKDLCG